MALRYFWKPWVRYLPDMSDWYLYCQGGARSMRCLPYWAWVPSWHQHSSPLCTWILSRPAGHGRLFPLFVRWVCTRPRICRVHQLRHGPYYTWTRISLKRGLRVCWGEIHGGRSWMQRLSERNGVSPRLGAARAGRRLLGWGLGFRWVLSSAVPHPLRMSQRHTGAVCPQSPRSCLQQLPSQPLPYNWRSLFSLRQLWLATILCSFGLHVGFGIFAHNSGQCRIVQFKSQQADHCSGRKPAVLRDPDFLNNQATAYSLARTCEISGGHRESDHNDRSRLLENIMCQSIWPPCHQVGWAAACISRAGVRSVFHLGAPSRVSSNWNPIWSRVQHPGIGAAAQRKHGKYFHYYINIDDVIWNYLKYTRAHTHTPRDYMIL